MTRATTPRAGATPGAPARTPNRCRLLKIICPRCGYTARITRLWLRHGLPVCPDGTPLREVPRP